MGKSTSQPATPDYAAAATAQGTANNQAALSSATMSNPNIYSPQGSQTTSYGYNSTTGTYQPTTTISLSPQEQSLYNTNLNTQSGLAGLEQYGLGQAQNVLSKPFDTSQLPAQAVAPGQTTQDAILSRLKPTIDAGNEQLTNQLVNQGFTPGTDAWQTGFRQQDNANNDLYTQAALAGIQNDQSNYQQQFQNQAYLRDLPLNEINSLMSSSQVQMPTTQAVQGATTQAAPIYQAAQNQYQSQLSAANAQNASSNNTTSGLYSVGAAALMAL